MLAQLKAMRCAEMHEACDGLMRCDRAGHPKRLCGAMHSASGPARKSVVLQGSASGYGSGVHRMRCVAILAQPVGSRCVMVQVHCIMSGVPPVSVAKG